MCNGEIVTLNSGSPFAIGRGVVFLSLFGLRLFRFRGFPFAIDYRDAGVSNGFKNAESFVFGSLGNPDVASVGLLVELLAGFGFSVELWAIEITEPEEFHWLLGFVDEGDRGGFAGAFVGAGRREDLDGGTIFGGLRLVFDELVELGCFSAFARGGIDEDVAVGF